jgi:lambda repressor-like predicted transcriptional regulator
MPSKVFISWSGELSKKLAEELRGWLPSVLQFVKPYFTPEDIEKGTSWYPNIASELASSNVGILCLTKDNVENPWILFEAGALSKNFDKANVCTILFDLDTSDLTGPLTNFQATRFVKDDFRKLIATINDTGNEQKLPGDTLDNVFEMWWPKLEEKIKKLLQVETKTTQKKRHERELLEEILELCRLRVRKETTSSSRPRMILEDVLDRLIDMERFIQHHSDASNMMLGHAFGTLDPPLQALCIELDMDSAYNEYRMRIRRNSRSGPSRSIKKNGEVEPLF